MWLEMMHICMEEERWNRKATPSLLACKEFGEKFYTPSFLKYYIVPKKSL